MLPDPGGRPVGFYVHHHGSGHATRCKQLAAALPTGAPYRFFGSDATHFPTPWRQHFTLLPPDVDPSTGPHRRDPSTDLLADEVLHYAPTDMPGLSQRMATIAEWIAEEQPAYFVVDLSVEIALFVRLCGCPVHLVRLHGRRTDLAHTAAFGLANSTLAPFAPCMEDAHTPAWLRQKTRYLGTFSRYDDRNEPRPQVRSTLGYGPDRPLVTVVNGSGGDDRDATYWGEVARRHPDHDWLLVGKLRNEEEPPSNLRITGYVADTYPYLRAADYIIGSGGTNTMSEVAAVRGRFISLPEPRPFEEQHCKMQALANLGLTVMLTERPEPQDWTSILARADELDLDGWRQLYTS